MLGRFRFGRLLGALALVGLASAVMPARAADTTPLVIYSIASLTGFGAFLGKAQQDTLQRLEVSVTRTAASKAVRFTSSSTTIKRTRRSRCNWSTKCWRKTDRPFWSAQV